MKAWYLTREQQADGSHVWVKSLEVDYEKAAEHEQILIRQMLGEK